jgi:hypothetical protein
MHVPLAALSIVMSKCKLHVFTNTINDPISVHRYISTVYLSFQNGIPSKAEHLFDLPKQWPSYCGNANTGNYSFQLFR